MKLYFVISLILTICAVMAALFSDEIRKAAKAGAKFKNVLLVFCAGVFAVGVITLTVSICS